MNLFSDYIKGLRASGRRHFTLEVEGCTKNQIYCEMLKSDNNEGVNMIINRFNIFPDQFYSDSIFC